MATVSYQKFQKASENVLRGVMNFGSDTFKAFLTNSAPNLSSHTVKADLTEITAEHGYSAGGFAVTMSVSRSSGTTKITATDGSLTASGGSIGPFRYVVIYDDTPTSPADPLVCMFDYGSGITLLDGDQLQLDFDDSAGLFTLA